MFTPRPADSTRWQEYCCEYGRFDPDGEIEYQTRCFLADSPRQAEAQALRHQRPGETIVSDVELHIPEWG